MICRLKGRFHFSFAEYSNPRNTSFGVLRVLNDDLVQPARGFGEHPHRNAEICTYIVQGELTHQVRVYKYACCNYSMCVVFMLHDLLHRGEAHTSSGVD